MLSNPSNIFISFAGDIDDAAAEKLAKDYFGDIPANPAGATKNPAYKFEGGDVRQTAALDQLNFMLAFEAPNGKDSDRFAAMMLKETLAGGMSRPLFQEIREKARPRLYGRRGLYAHRRHRLFHGRRRRGQGQCGRTRFSVTVDLFGQVARDGFPQQDLDEARERIMRRLNSNLETAASTASSNLSEIVDKGRITPPAEFEANLKKVTPDDIKRVAYNMLNAGKLGLSAVGPLDTLPPEQDIKDMMKAQVAGITPPAKQPATPPLTAAFNAAAQAPAAAPSGVPKMTVLPNGLKVITLERPGNLSAGAWVGAGSDYEARRTTARRICSNTWCSRARPTGRPAPSTNMSRACWAGA